MTPVGSLTQSILEILRDPGWTGVGVLTSSILSMTAIFISLKSQTSPRTPTTLLKNKPPYIEFTEKYFHIFPKHTYKPNIQIQAPISLKKVLLFGK